MQYGFSLIETLIAIFLLSVSVGALMTVTTGSFFSIRYARNQVIGGNLMQEAIEYIKNTKDTAVQQGVSWSNWQDQVLKKNELGLGTGCFTSSGCTLDIYTTQPQKITSCGTQCPTMVLYQNKGVYGYSDTYPFEPSTATSFRRTLRAQQTIDPNQVELIVTMSWRNGNIPRTIQQSLLLTNWIP